MSKRPIVGVTLDSEQPGGYSKYPWYALRQNYADAIAAVNGVDVLLMGTSDLTAELGISGQMGHPKVVDAYEKVIAACRKHGKFAGMGGMYTPELLERHINMGVQLILSGSDFSLIMQAAQARARLVCGERGIQKRRGDAAGLQRVHLVLHQGNQRRDNNGQPVAGERRELEAK